MSGSPVEVLVDQRKRLLARLETEREQLEIVEALAEKLHRRISDDEQMLEDIESVLGRAPQLRLDEADIRLRGRRLEEIAIAVLAEERGDAAEIHYREWFELLRARGHLVAGKRPLDNFLALLARSEAVESLGRRSGVYRLRQQAA